MTIADAQRDVRTAFAGGFAGQLISGVIWLIAAALSTWSAQRSGWVVLVLGGAMIFPLTQLLLKALGYRGALLPNNPMQRLAMQSAFVIPALLPLIGAAAMYRPYWFYPGMMAVVGAHYFTFVFLYGMNMFWVLGGLLLASAYGFVWYLPHETAPGWFTGVVLMVFAVIGRRLVRPELTTRR